MKKLVFWIVVLVIIIAGIIGYNRYMHGNLKIDRELISDENFDLIAENWEKLLNSNLGIIDVTEHDHTVYDILFPETQNIEGRHFVAIFDPPDDSAFSLVMDDNPRTVYLELYVRENAAEDYEARIDEARYSRALPFHLFREFTRDYKSRHSIVYASNPLLTIRYSEYHSSMTACSFETIMQTLIEQASAE